MKKTLWIWTALCALTVGIAFFTLPAWETEGYAFFSGAELFTMVVVIVSLVWLAGLVLLAVVFTVLRSLPRDRDGLTVWSRRRTTTRTAIVLGVLVVAGLGATALVSAGGEESSTFVDFDTADADPSWSPDGRVVAFTSNRRAGSLFVVRPDGTRMRPVFRGEASDVDWSPDGDALAFVGAGGIYVLRLGEAKPELVVRGSGFSHPDWAPSGEALAFVQQEPGAFETYNGPIHETSDAIYVVRLDGSGLHRLLPRFRGAVGDARPGSIAAVAETDPAWSPDGTQIAFQAGDGQVVVADVATGRRTTIDGFAAYEPSWSLDGRSIAYQCEGDLCVASSDGGAAGHKIASDGGDPSWSPDSRSIVFEHSLYGGTGFSSRPQSLSIVGANGEGLRKLTFGP